MEIEKNTVKKSAKNLWGNTRFVRAADLAAAVLGTFSIVLVTIAPHSALPVMMLIVAYFANLPSHFLRLKSVKIGKLQPGFMLSALPPLCITALIFSGTAGYYNSELLLLLASLLTLPSALNALTVYTLFKYAKQPLDSPYYAAAQTDINTELQCPYGKEPPLFWVQNIYEMCLTAVIAVYFFAGLAAGTEKLQLMRAVCAAAICAVPYGAVRELSGFFTLVKARDLTLFMPPYFAYRALRRRQVWEFWDAYRLRVMEILPIAHGRTDAAIAAFNALPKAAKNTDLQDVCQMLRQNSDKLNRAPAETVYSMERQGCTLYRGKRAEAFLLTRQEIVSALRGELPGSDLSYLTKDYAKQAAEYLKDVGVSDVLMPTYIDGGISAIIVLKLAKGDTTKVFSGSKCRVLTGSKFELGLLTAALSGGFEDFIETDALPEYLRRNPNYFIAKSQNGEVFVYTSARAPGTKNNQDKTFSTQKKGNKARTAEALTKDTSCNVKKSNSVGTVYTQSKALLSPVCCIHGTADMDIAANLCKKLAVVSFKNIFWIIIYNISAALYFLFNPDMALYAPATAAAAYCVMLQSYAGIRRGSAIKNANAV